jgi:predicted CXXCH cytochrome family protein
MPVRPRFKDVEHLLRFAGLFLAGLIVFVVVRNALVPEDFGRLGHYRASALDDSRAKPLVHAGQAACAECHADVVELRSPSRHAAVACEGCHGPLAAHATGADERKPARPDGRELCVRCHAANAGRPAWFRTVSARDHAGDEPCITCHRPHAPAIR